MQDVLRQLCCDADDGLIVLPIIGGLEAGTHRLGAEQLQLALFRACLYVSNSVSSDFFPEFLKIDSAFLDRAHTSDPPPLATRAESSLARLRSSLKFVDRYEWIWLGTGSAAVVMDAVLAQNVSQLHRTAHVLAQFCDFFHERGLQVLEAARFS